MGRNKMDIVSFCLVPLGTRTLQGICKLWRGPSKANIGKLSFHRRSNRRRWWESTKCMKASQRQEPTGTTGRCRPSARSQDLLYIEYLCKDMPAEGYFLNYCFFMGHGNILCYSIKEDFGRDALTNGNRYYDVFRYLYWLMPFG